MLQTSFLVWYELTMLKMKAIIHTQTEKDTTLEIKNVDLPIPTHDQLLVKVKAFGLNRADLLQKKGLYPAPSGESPVLGLEIAGEVAQVPPDCPDFKVGDRVFGLVGGGAYAEFCLLHKKMAIKTPPELSDIEAAAIPEAFMTANETLFQYGQLKSGESVLIHAAGSGVGTTAIQLAKLAGATVYTTVGNPSKTKKVLNLGVDFAFNYLQEDFDTDIAVKLLQKIDLIHDPIGAKYLESHLSLLKERGRLVIFATMGGKTGTADLSLILQKRLTIKGFVLRRQSLEEKIEVTERFKAHCLPLIYSNKVRPIIDKVYNWTQIAEAHDYLESRASFGKVIVYL